MKKNALVLSITAGFLLFANTVKAEEKHTISLGYAQSHVTGDLKHFTRSHNDDLYGGNSNDLKGLNLKYRYEIDENLGIMGSLTSTYTENKSSTIAATKSYQIKSSLAYISLMAGPTWRINEYVSIYGMAGIARIEAEINNPVAIPFYQNEVSKKLAMAAGVQLNLTPNLAIDLGYEYTRAKFGNVTGLSGETKDYSGKIGTWTAGVGFRF